MPGPEFIYNLRLHTSVLAGAEFVRDITQDAQQYRRSIRLNGGYWQATFSLTGTMAQMVDAFYTWLGWHVEESVQGVNSWQGMIYEMVLNTPNASRVRSLDKLYNHARVTYVDGAGADGETAVAYIQASIDRYGRKEAIEDVGKFDLTAANARRDTYLKEFGWPFARPQASGPGGNEASLDVTVCGYIFTANWRHTTTANDATSTVHDWLSLILTTDCAEFLSVGTLGANTTAVERSVQDSTRCWDLIKSLNGVGDASGNIYRSYVGHDRKFYYEMLDKYPQFYVVQGMIAGRLEATEALNPWLVKPGIFMDMDTPLSYINEGSFLGNVRHIIVDEVTVGAMSGLSWQALDYSESAQLAALQEMMSAGAGTPAVGGGAGGRSVTDAMLIKMKVSRAKWSKMTPAQRRAAKKKL